jgi:HEAT repeat protein
MRRNGLRISDDIDALSAAERVEQAKHLEAFLDHPSLHVRMSAAKALGSVDLGEEALLRRLRMEKNELVVCDICDALSSMMAVNAVPDLREVANYHPGPLARRFALLALFDLSGKESLPFFQNRLRYERNRAARSTLHYLTFISGAREALAEVLKSFLSKSSLVRSSAANRVQQYPPTHDRTELIKGLDRAIAREKFSGIKQELAEARDLLLRGQRLREKSGGSAPGKPSRPRSTTSRSSAAAPKREN